MDVWPEFRSRRILGPEDNQQRCGRKLLCVSNLRRGFAVYDRIDGNDPGFLLAFHEEKSRVHDHHHRYAYNGTRFHRERHGAGWLDAARLLFMAQEPDSAPRDDLQIAGRHPRSFAFFKPGQCTFEWNMNCSGAFRGAKCLGNAPDLSHEADERWAETTEQEYADQSQRNPAVGDRQF